MQAFHPPLPKGKEIWAVSWSPCRPSSGLIFPKLLCSCCIGVDSSSREKSFHIVPTRTLQCNRDTWVILDAVHLLKKKKKKTPFTNKQTNFFRNSKELGRVSKLPSQLNPDPHPKQMMLYIYICFYRSSNKQFGHFFQSSIGFRQKKFTLNILFG